MAEITDAMLKEWEGLCQRATAEPWRKTVGVQIWSAALSEGTPPMLLAELGRSPVPDQEQDDNLAFIAAARTALPLLIAEIRRLRHGG